MKRILTLIMALVLSFAFLIVLSGCDMVEELVGEVVENGNLANKQPVYPNGTNDERPSVGNPDTPGDDGYDSNTEPNNQGLSYTLSNDGTYYILTGSAYCFNSDIVIPATYNDLPVKEIGSGAFSYCGNVKNVVIPDNITNIHEGAFYRSLIESISVSENNTAYKSIDGNLYSKDGKTLIQYMTSKTATEFTVPESVTTIGIGAFARSYSLQRVVIGDGVTTIGYAAFESCSALTDIKIDENNEVYKTIDGNLYTKDGKIILHYIISKKDVSFTVPESVTTIANYAFYDAFKLKSVVIGDGVTYIGDSAFAFCQSLSNVEIPKSVTYIGDSAFAQCHPLNINEIPESVTYIGDNAFYCCCSLTDIAVNENNTAYKSIDGNLYTKDGKTILQYALGKPESSFIIPDGVTKISPSAFAECVRLKSVEIPEGVTLIGDHAFEGCRSLTGIVFPDSVTHIGDWVFTHCESLASVVIGEGTVTIGLGAFYNCDSLTSIVIPDSVTVIGNSAFAACDNITNVEIGNGVTVIGSEAFSGCVSLTSVKIPDNVRTIGTWAFSNCNGLTSVVIGKGVKTVAEFAFVDCNNLDRIYYNGTKAGWSEILIDDYNDAFTDDSIYYYSENEPSEKGNFWHYNEDGTAVSW